MLTHYFKISEQMHMQAEPEYCGPGTLIMVLNTLKVDPKSNWRGYNKKEYFDGLLKMY